MKRAMTEYDFASQTSGWQHWAQPQGYYKKLGAKVLAIGIASALATVAPLTAEAAIQTVTQEVSLINQPVDMDADGIPDLLCMAGEDTDTDNWTNTSYLYCHTFGGARIWGNAEACLSVTANQQPPAGGGWQAVCQLSDSVDNGKSEVGSSAGPSTKTLRIRTSGKSDGWINVVVNAANTDVKTVSWAYVPPNLNGENGTTPVLTGLTAEIIKGQAALNWDKNESGITGFKIYRNSQLIAEIPSDKATFYTDNQFTQQQCSVIYKVDAVNASGGVSRSATATINIPDCGGPLPSSRLFVKVDSQCAGRVTTSPDVGIDCAASDCQLVKTRTGEKELNCKPAQCSAGLGLDKLGETITLIPQLGAGCEFLRNWKGDYNWGGHDDCADGELTVTTGNKMCIAFFHKVPPPTSSSGRRGSHVPASLPITPSLPSLGNGMKIGPNGQNGSTTAQFNGGVSVNGSDYQLVVTVKDTDLLKIRGMISMDSLHLPLTTDTFVHISYQATGQGKLSHWMVDENGQILPWDENPAHLVPFRTGVPSASGLLEVEIFREKMLARGLESGKVAITFGYRLEDGRIIYGSQPIEIHVVK